MKRIILLSLVTILASTSIIAQDVGYRISLKIPGNPATTYQLSAGEDGMLRSKTNLPIEINRKRTSIGDGSTLEELTLTAKETVYFNFEKSVNLDFMHTDCQFYMPGFWYRRNLRSPQEAPSFHTSDSWQVREDRLSTPLTGVFNEQTGDYYTILRLEDEHKECLTTHQDGEVILSGETSIGSTGFENIDGKTSLVVGYPYSESPKSYIRKLTLAPSVQTFMKLENGKSITLKWEISSGTTNSFSSFVAHVWNYSYDRFQPQKVERKYSDRQAKDVLTNFFKESYVDKYDLKYYSGVHLRTDDCESTGSIEVGFVGRVLLNAFNALEYGEAYDRKDLVDDANVIFNSYLKHGFTSNGFFREFIDKRIDDEPDVYSIRRQSEGAFAILNYLDYERRNGRVHKEWELRIASLLDNFLKLQNVDGSYPRKFKNDFTIVDATGGSTPSATLPLAMAFKYWGTKKYLESAKSTARYLEEELISKSDYFSSTLDANCEDKEASLYAATAMYYMSFVTKGKEREHYIDLCKQSAYFTLSWYYMWDVPFAQGQMLGDVGFKSRGWGNVSVENNHIDVFIFEFATVLDWLSRERKEPRFGEFSDVIKSSMLQLMPTKGNMYNIGKVGYYPEVVQHTNWDYGRNGKGFYNDIFAPGWTVASLWQMLSPDRVENFFKKTK